MPTKHLRPPAALALLLLALGVARPALPAALPAETPGASVSAGALAAGDAAWGRRAEGRDGWRAAPGPVDAAIAAYERALREDPGSLEAAWKLLRALHFKGEYVARTQEEKQAIFGRGRAVMEAALDRLGRRLGGRAKLDTASPAEAARALSGVPEAPYLFLWGAVDWGLWGDAFGRLAAARQGVGERVRRYSEIVTALDPAFEDGAGHRVLGRLHTLAPKIPLFTGWVDRDKAVAELRRAVRIGPADLNNHLFLAEALVEHFPAKSEEARAILRRLLQRRPAPGQVVEDEKTLADARALLAKHAK